MSKKVNSLQLKDEKAQLKKRAQSIIDKVKLELRDLTEDEEKEIEDIKTQIKEKDEELKALQERLDGLTVEEEETQEVENKRKFSNKDMKKQKFSLLRSIRSIVNNQPLDAVDLAVIKAGQEEARKAGINVQGQIQIPTNEERAIVTVADEGEDVVETEIWDIMTPLRAKNVLVNAGARFLSGLVGNVQVPIMDKTNVTWEGEIDPAKDGAPTFSHKTLSPKRLTAYVAISKLLLAQTGESVEQSEMTLSQQSMQNWRKPSLAMRQAQQQNQQVSSMRLLQQVLLTLLVSVTKRLMLRTQMFSETANIFFPIKQKPLCV